MINRRQTMALIAAPLAAPVLAQADPWPSKPVTLVLPFPAGGQTDAVARLLARHLEAQFGQAFVVVNRPGANSLIGTQMVARAQADGHTLLLNMTALVTNPILLPNVQYDAVQDFAPVTRLYEIPAVWAVPPNTARTLDEFVRMARASEKPFTFGTTGHASSSHYYGEMFARAVDIPLLHIPYKGEAPLLPDLMGGRLNAAVVSSGATIQYGQDGRLRPLAVSGKRRWKNIPEVPTFAELGVPGLTTETFAGIFAPAGTPQTVIEQLYTAIKRILALSEVQEQMRTNALEVAPDLTPSAFADLMNKARDEWTEIKKHSTIRIEGGV